jgi:hypothetical protein
MNDPRRKLESVIGALLSTKEDKIKYIGGLLGTYDANGQEVVDVENRPDFVYVRIGGNFGEVIEAFNQSVFPEFNTKVLLQKSQLGNFYEVFGRDVAQYPTWDQNAFISVHALTHSFGVGDNEGGDPVFIYKRQLLQPLGVHPNPTGAYSAIVEGDFYQWQDDTRYFPGATTVDFSYLKPTGSTAKFVTVYLDGLTESIKYYTGVDFYPSVFVTGTIDYIPDVAQNVGIPLAAIYLTSGTSEIDWDSIYDLRPFLKAGEVKAGVVTVLDAANYFTGSTVEAALAEIFIRTTGSVGGAGSSALAIFDDSIFKVSGTAISFDGGLQVVTTGSIAYVSFTGSVGGATANQLPIFDDGVFKVSGTAISFDAGLDVVTTGSNAYVNIRRLGVDVYDDSILKLSSGIALSFDAGLRVITTGNTAYIDWVGNDLDQIAFYEHSVFKVSGTAISFEDGLAVVVTGSTIYVRFTGTSGGAGADIYTSGQLVVAAPTKISIDPELSAVATGTVAFIGMDMTQFLVRNWIGL